MVEFLEFGGKLVTFGLVLGQIGNFLICSLLNKVILARKFKHLKINFQPTFSCRTIIPNISFPLNAPIEYPSSKISEIESSKAGILKRKKNCIISIWLLQKDYICLPVPQRTQINIDSTRFKREEILPQKFQTLLKMFRQNRFQFKGWWIRIICHLDASKVQTGLAF